MSPLPQPEPEEEGPKGAPRYMTAYCAIMTLLLAFFIILQAFADVQGEGLFYAGRGSFVRALETFGLGGVWGEMGGRMAPGAAGPRYPAPEGQDEPSRLRRIDAEREEAQRALRDLQRQYDVQDPERGAGWRVTLPTPFSYSDWEGGLTAEHAEFLQDLARRLEPLIAARGFVIRVGAVVRGSEQREVELTRQSLQAAEDVRRKLIGNLSIRLQAAAADRIYSFCRRESPEEAPAGAPATHLRVDIMLTKPYVSRFQREGERHSETSESGTPS